MFQLAILIVILGSLLMIRHLLALQKHDRVLFRFCQIRRDMMSYVRQPESHMSRDEYIALRQLMDTLNFIIHDYKTHKLVYFNLRKLRILLKEYQIYSKRAERIEIKNKEINNFRNNLQLALMYAFIAYTPFLKSKLLFELVIILLNCLAKIGLFKVNGYTRVLKETFQIKRHHQQLAGFC